MTDAKNGTPTVFGWFDKITKGLDFLAPMNS